MESLINFRIFVVGTPRCNLNCHYCGTATKHNSYQYDPDNILRSVKTLYQNHHHNGIPNDLAISGGEPLLEIKLIEDLLAIMGKDTNLMVFTNTLLLTEDNDNYFKTLAKEVRYVVGLDATGLKSPTRILENDTVIKLIHEDRLKYIYVVNGTEDVGQIERDLKILLDNKMCGVFNFNYHGENRDQEIVKTAKLLTPVFRELGYQPRETGMDRINCSSISVHRDGSYTLACADKYSAEQVKKFYKFRTVVCSGCKYRKYCASCYTNAVFRYGLGNYCEWVKAQCAYIEEVI